MSISSGLRAEDILHNGCGKNSTCPDDG